LELKCTPPLPPVNDPETIVSLERNADLKFVAVSEYKLMKKEIGSVGEKLTIRNEDLQQRTAKGGRSLKNLNQLGRSMKASCSVLMQYWSWISFVENVRGMMAGHHVLKGWHL